MNFTEAELTTLLEALEGARDELCLGEDMDEANEYAARIDALIVRIEAERKNR